MTDVVTVTYTGGPAGDWITKFRSDRTLLSTAQDAVDTVKLFFDAWQSRRSSSISAVISNTVEVVDPITGQPTGVETVSGYTLPGGATGDVLPWQTQALITWNTGTWISGRQVRGRTFIGGLVEAMNSATGLPDGALLTDLATAAGHLITPIDGVFGIYSRVHQNTYPIVAATVSPRWSVLRTRR